MVLLIPDEVELHYFVFDALLRKFTEEWGKNTFDTLIVCSMNHFGPFMRNWMMQLSCLGYRVEGMTEKVDALVATIPFHQ